MSMNWKTLRRFGAGLLGFMSAGAATVPADSAGRHDLYVCAAISPSNRVMGSKDATPNGIFRRNEDGTFSHVGLNYPLLISLAFDPRDPRCFYAASVSGILRTLDGGLSWRITTGWNETEPKSVAIDPVVPDTVYAGLPDGFIVSRDRGQTWSRCERGLPARGKYTQVIAVDRTQAGRVLAGCETGIYVTDDYARSWQRIFATRDTVDDLQQSPHDPRSWIAVTQSAGALRSLDGGLSWLPIPGLPSDRALYNVAFDPIHAQRIVIASWTYGLLASEDGGHTWTERNEGLPNRHRVWRTAIDPNSGRLYAAVHEQALYESDDFGRTWRIAGLEGSVIQSFTFVRRND